MIWWWLWVSCACWIIRWCCESITMSIDEILEDELYMMWVCLDGNWIYDEYELLFVHDCFVVDYVSDMFVDGETLHVLVEYVQIGVVHHLETSVN